MFDRYACLWLVASMVARVEVELWVCGSHQEVAWSPATTTTADDRSINALHLSLSSFRLASFWDGDVGANQSDLGTLLTLSADASAFARANVSILRIVIPALSESLPIINATFFPTQRLRFRV